MPLLGRLAACRRVAAGPVAASSPTGEALVDLAARMLFFARSQTRAWEWLPPLMLLRRAPMLRGHVRRAVADLVAALFGPADSATDPSAQLNLRAARRFVRRRARELARQFLADRKAGETEWHCVADYSRALLLRPIHAPHVTTDAEVMTAPEDRTLSFEAYERIVDQDQKAVSRQRRLLRAADRASAELGHARSCEELLAVR